jgi:ribokinase
MLDVITIGTATRDVFMRDPAFDAKSGVLFEKMGFPGGQGVCLPKGGKVEVGECVATVGGGAANAAVTFARQGLRAACAAGLGTDELGRQVIAHMAREKIALIPVWDTKRGTAFSTILLSRSGERTILNYRGASQSLTYKALPSGRLKAKAAFFVPGRIPLPAIRECIAHFKKEKSILAMAPSLHYLELGPRKLGSFLKDLDVIVMNREEASRFTSVPYENEKEIFKKLDKLVAGIAVMTEGPKGVMVSDGTVLVRAGCFKEKQVADRTGAGDAFASGFVAGLLHHAAPSQIKNRTVPPGALKEAVRLASANATGVVETIGAQEGVLTRALFAASRRFKSLTMSVENL